MGGKTAMFYYSCQVQNYLRICLTIWNIVVYVFLLILLRLINRKICG